jgi:hypothetical protein
MKGGDEFVEASEAPQTWQFNFLPPKKKKEKKTNCAGARGPGQSQIKFVN